MVTFSRMTLGAGGLVLLGLVACDRSGTSSDQSPPAPTPAPIVATRDGGASATELAGGSMRDGSSASLMLVDSQVVVIVKTANGGELDQANLAAGRATSGKVKTFAQHMIKDHTQAGSDLADLARRKSLTDQTSDDSQRLSADGAALLKRLQSSAVGAAFDRQYMDAQVKEHQDLLDMLDTRLIPSAKDPDLSAFLKKLRDKVADHLKMAREVDTAVQS